MVTLKEVAREANVSFSTVSRVVNKPEMVQPETRARVQEAIEALGYRPHRAARRLRGQAAHAQIFGLIIPDIENPFYSGIVRGVEERAYAEGFAVILSNTNEDPAREQFYLDILRQEAAAGAIVPPLAAGTPLSAEALGFPVVCFDRRPAGLDADTVVVANEAGAYEAVSHLVALGHRRIGHLSASHSLSTSVERTDGYRRALREAGLPVDKALVRTGEPRPESGRTLAHDLLTGPAPPTALFVGNNVIAMGALTIIQELGLDVPGEVAVVTFDDPPWARLVSPPLTVVRQPTYEIGRQAADLLMRRIADPDRTPTTVTLPTEFVVRGSCGVRAAQASTA